MIILLFISIVLIWLHTYNLRFIIKTYTGSSRIKYLKKVKKTAVSEKNIPSGSLLLILIPLIIVITLNLVEIGYFVYSNYIFNDLIVTIGSAILVGYTLNSMIKFLPKVRYLTSKPFIYLIGGTQGYEIVLNYIMTPLEIGFCSYIMVKVLIFLLNL